MRIKPQLEHTGVYEALLNGNIPPPLNIFDYGAKEEEDSQVKVSWVEGTPCVKNKMWLI